MPLRRRLLLLDLLPLPPRAVATGGRSRPPPSEWRCGRPADTQSCISLSVCCPSSGSAVNAQRQGVQALMQVLVLGLVVVVVAHSARPSTPLPVQVPLRCVRLLRAVNRL